MSGIDWEATKQEILQRAEVGLVAAGEHALARARHHAPVRAIFKRDRRGKAFTGKGPISTKAAYSKFLVSKARSRRVDIGRFVTTGQKDVTVKTATGKVEQRKISVGGDYESASFAAKQRTNSVITKGRRIGDATGTSFSGHANSFAPVLRKNGYRITGDFRRVGPVADVIRQRKGQASRPLREESLTMHGRGNMIENFRVRALSSRGRYEVKRATTKGMGNSGLFRGRVGGRLRGELHLKPPQWRGDTLWVYVESPTEYGPYQEFGTTRNRAQPFLRPALYESRGILRSKVRSAIGKPMVVVR